ncbi:hypothetical protein CC80DRAFT_566311 [Byssothecium circinans]|uniref:Rhodopsin domain-containing protein n=1 Tax=Byssothecium circinans TaxID=147558 RepID=A0A6A5TQX5_9PLEO|nr:hypothetical protein CC80DRAFT_566311 [Byssothecium circinans]
MEGCQDPRTLDPNVCPALPPPPGVTPMNPNADTIMPYLIDTVIACLAVVVPAVALRIFTKGYILRRLQVEDYSLLLALVAFAATNGLNVKAQDFGCGKHMWDVSITHVMISFKYINWVSIVYAISVFFVKLALLLQIQRIFAAAQKGHTFWITWALILSNGAFYISVMFAYILQCTPRAKIWNPTIPGKCIDVRVVSMASGVINIMSDVAIFALPVTEVLRLHMPLRRKLGITAVFATGAIACAACVIRFVYVRKLIATMDVTYWAVLAGIWSAVELATAFLCCCFPTFPCFYTWIRGKGRKNSSCAYVSNPTPKSTHTSTNPQSAHQWDEAEEGGGPYIELDEGISSRSEAPTAGDSTENLRGPRSGAIMKTTEIETTSFAADAVSQEDMVLPFDGEAGSLWTSSPRMHGGSPPFTGTGSQASVYTC